MVKGPSVNIKVNNNFNLKEKILSAVGKGNVSSANLGGINGNQLSSNSENISFSLDNNDVSLINFDDSENMGGKVNSRVENNTTTNSFDSTSKSLNNESLTSEENQNINFDRHQSTTNQGNHTSNAATEQPSFQNTNGTPRSSINQMNTEIENDSFDNRGINRNPTQSIMANGTETNGSSAQSGIELYSGSVNVSGRQDGEGFEANDNISINNSRGSNPVSRSNTHDVVQTLSDEDYEQQKKEYERALNEQLQFYEDMLDENLNQMKQLKEKYPQAASAYLVFQDKIESTAPGAEEYNKKREELENEKIILQQAIAKIEEQIERAPYDFLIYNEDYQNYEFDRSRLDSELEELDKRREKVVDNAHGIRQGDRNASEFYDMESNLASIINDNENIVKTFYYIKDTQGEEAAREYYNAVENEINQIIGKRKAQEFLDSLSDEENVGSAILNHLNVTKKGLGDGVDTFLDGLYYAIEGLFSGKERNYSIDDFEKMYILQMLQDGEAYGALLSNNYEISQAIGNMVPSIAISIATTSVGLPNLGVAAMGVSAGGNSYHQAVVKYDDRGRAILYGVISGVSEATLEHAIGGIPGLGSVKVTSLKNFVKASISESIEEGTQEYIQALLDTGIFGEEFDIDEVSKNALKSAIYGMITAGIMNGPSLTINGIAQASRPSVDAARESSVNNDASVSEAANSAPHVNEPLQSNNSAPIQSMSDASRDSLNIPSIKPASDASKVSINVPPTQYGAPINRNSTNIAHPIINTLFSKNSNDYYSQLNALADSLHKIFQQDYTSDDDSVLLLINALTDSAKSNDEALAIMKTLLKLKKNDRGIIIAKTTQVGSNVYRNILSLGSDTLKNIDIRGSRHELGHLLFNTVCGEKVPIEFQNQLQYIRQYVKNGGKLPKLEYDLYNVENQCAVAAEKIFLNEIAKNNFYSEEEYRMALAEKYRNNFYNAQSTLQYKLQRLGYVADTMNKFINNVTLDDYVNQDILAMKNMYKDGYYRRNFGQYVAISDMVDALFFGQDLGIYLSYHHGQQYYDNMITFPRKLTQSFHELIANYTDVRLSGSVKEAKMLNDLFGQDLINILDKIFQEFLEYGDKKQFFKAR